MQPRNPDYEATVIGILNRAAFVADLGIVLTAVGPGWCETELAIVPRHLQQNGYVHAGVLATVGDHTAGAAAGSMVGAGEGVLTVEFKINLLRPAQGERVRCRAQVLRAGRTLTVVEAEMFAVAGSGEKLVAKSTVTLSVVTEAPTTSDKSVAFAGIDHVQLAAPPGCEAGARRFFGELLGLRELPKPAPLAARGGLWFQCGAQQIHIGVEKDFREAKKAHPALRLTSETALGELRARLEAGGVPTREDREIEGSARFFADDPWGNRLEFVAALSQPPSAS